MTKTLQKTYKMNANKMFDTSVTTDSLSLRQVHLSINESSASEFTCLCRASPSIA